MVGGEHEEGRNLGQNHLRLARIEGMAIGIPREQTNILDFGCGHGYLVEYLQNSGFPNVQGFDAYSVQFSTLPSKEKYHIITAIEVFEHTSAPFVEIDLIWRSLVDNGLVMIESSFVNVADEENIPLEEFFYIAPQNGHATIFSHHGLDLLMTLRGFVPRQHWDRQVRLYQKVNK
jgi:2-polyprenyl-3-methyl-5-hydroxy-6-metoxy-1,4-benzoquinol methylase